MINSQSNHFPHILRKILWPPYTISKGESQMFLLWLIGWLGSTMGTSVDNGAHRWRGGEWYLEKRGSRKILPGSWNLGGVFAKSQSLVFAWFDFTFFESWNFLPKSLRLGFLTRISGSRILPFTSTPRSNNWLDQRLSGKSSLVFSARFPIVKWRSHSVAKSAYFWEEGAAVHRLKSSQGAHMICVWNWCHFTVNVLD